VLLIVFIYFLYAGYFPNKNYPGGFDDPEKGFQEPVAGNITNFTEGQQTTMYQATSTNQKATTEEV
jgi:hypothetical protein